MVAAQLQVQSALWDEWAQRDETRREHLIELQHLYGFQPFTSRKYREIARGLIRWRIERSSQWSREAGMSEFHFSRAFKRRTELTPSQYFI
jgi:AraC-like DNA-binding protein